jgi:ribosome-associated protein
LAGIPAGDRCPAAQLLTEVTLLTIALKSDTLDQVLARTEQGAFAAAAAVPTGPAPEAVLQAVIESLEDSKAEEIVPIDIAGRSSLADVMVIASGRSHRHVGAIADHLDKKLHELGVRQLRVEGLPHCDWVLVDAGDIMVHLFRPEVRSFYNLEKMWQVETPPARTAAKS